MQIESVVVEGFTYSTSQGHGEMIRRLDSGCVKLCVYGDNIEHENNLAQMVGALPDLVEAALMVLDCQKSGSFGSDGERGLEWLRLALKKAGVT